jgi:hypothetical protein
VTLGKTARQHRLGGDRTRDLTGGPCPRRGVFSLDPMSAFERIWHLAVGTLSPRRIGVGREVPFGAQVTLQGSSRARVVNSQEVMRLN